MATIAIIGAGMAGLSAGRELLRAGHSVTVFEKSRGLGGRAATRRVAGFSFDHGAQYLKAPTPQLAALVAEAGDAVDIERPVWVFDAAGQVIPGDPAQNADPKWTWPAGITALAKHLAAGQRIIFDATVGRLEALAQGAGAHYLLYDAAGGQLGAFDALLLTAPAPQSSAILAASAIAPERCALLLDALAQAHYRRCISVTLAYARRPELPWYALVNSDRQHPVSWLACEHAKPDRAPPSAGLLIAQMSHAWSVTHWDALEKGTYARGDPPPAAALVAHQLASALVGQDLGEPLWLNLQRWRYALPDAGCDEAALNSALPGLFVAGDMLPGQGRLHLAIESGWRVAGQMLAALQARQ